LARFNDAREPAQPRTVNLAGGRAYRQSGKLTLAGILLTSFLDDQYYRSADQTLAELVELTQSVDPLFAAKAAVYVRTQFGVRSVTHVVAGETAARVKGEQWPKRFYDAVVTRPDDVTEILAYYASAYGLHPLPNKLKKGLAHALRGFDDYQFAKYHGRGKRIGRVDAVNLCHPKATAPLTRLMSGALPPADTWEVALTHAGQDAGNEPEKASLKRETWQRLLRERRLGYFALLRNLRNIIEAGGTEAVEIATQQIADERAIRASHVLPFRFPAAIKSIATLAPPGVITALEQALEIAFDNVPELDGMTLVAVDSSGSMTWQEGGSRPVEKAILLAMAVVKRSQSDVLLFDEEARFVSVDPAATFACTMDRLKNEIRGGGTSFPAIFDAAEKPYDRVIILSDMQAWVEDDWGFGHPGPAFERYKLRTGARPAVYCFDLQGYGTMQFPAHRVFQLAGYSDKVFDVMPKLEEDREALAHAIEAVVF
jgi:TROVE domain.